MREQVREDRQRQRQRDRAREPERLLFELFSDTDLSLFLSFRPLSRSAQMPSGSSAIVSTSSPGSPSTDSSKKKVVRRDIFFGDFNEYICLKYCSLLTFNLIDCAQHAKQF